MTRLLPCALWAMVLAASGCADPTPREVFEAQVVPVLERSCSAGSCHGVAPGAEAAGDVIDWSLLFFPVDERGHITDVDRAYEAARRVIDTGESPRWSTLLRKSLDVAHGGLPHYGGASFASPDDPGYRAIARWVEVEDAGGEDAAPLNGAETVFAETVQPVLLGARCATASCHGLRAAVPFRLQGPLGGTLSVRATRANYEMALRSLSLDGDGARSRLLRKALPLHAGGIVHKGGNGAFLDGSDDPRALAIVAWACREREERVGAPCTNADASPIEGIVFVRGPLAPGALFDLDVFAPGSDLWFADTPATDLSTGEPRNLTAGLHAEPADVRDPAVDASGRRLVFSMRTSAEEGHSLWTLDLHSGEAQRLTTAAGPLPNGGLGTDRDPTWGPDGHVWFVSTRAGTVADGGGLLDADLYELDPVSGALLRRTVTPHIERRPVFYVIGEEAGGEVSFTALRDAIGPTARAHVFRFPPDLATEYHQHFGITPPETVFWDMRELPDGRYVTTIGGLAGVWGAGRLGVVERNFGPELGVTAASTAGSLPFYADPLVRLDPNAKAEGLTEALYRDPAPLPDGRILASFASGPVDLEDPTVTPDLGIVVLTLTESPDGSGPSITDRTALLDTPGIADWDPEPVYARATARLSAVQHWDPAATTGLIRHQGLPRIDALLSNLPPSGTKQPRTDLRAVRLIEALPATPSDRAPLSPDESPGNVTDATTSGIGGHGPARILCELPLAADGTFQAALPPNTPFRIQGLDEDGMAVGAMHNRWFYALPGQVIPQGVSTDRPGVYGTLCAACHGAADGDPDHTFVEPDVLTTASLTLSRYEDQNPRRPIAPPLCGAEARVSVDFRSDVQPVLDRACATTSCHGGTEPAAGLDLRGAKTTFFTVAYESLLADGPGSGGGKRWVDARTGSALSSALTEVLLGRELAAPRHLTGPGKRHPSAGALTDAELQTLIRWMDLGATFRGTLEAP